MNGIFGTMFVGACVCVSSIRIVSILSFVPAVPCQLNLTGPEGYIEAPPQTSSAFHSTTDCSYVVTVYLGYGVEVQVRATTTSIHPAYVVLLKLFIKAIRNSSIPTFKLTQILFTDEWKRDYSVV